MGKIIRIIIILNILIYAEAAQFYIKESIKGIKNDSLIFDIVSNKTLKNQKNRYTINNLFDGKLETCWVTSIDNISNQIYDDGIFKIIFKKPIYVDSLEIYNGYQKSQKLYYDNQRVKTIEVEKVIIGGRNYPLSNTFNLNDDPKGQTLSLTDEWTDTINLFKTKELIINISEYYKAKKYKDLCISEIKIKHKKKSDYTPSVSFAKLVSLINKNKKSHPVKKKFWYWNELINNNYKLFNDFLYYVLADNVEAIKLFNSYMPLGAGESESMTNIYMKAVKESLKME